MSRPPPPDGERCERNGTRSPASTAREKPVPALINSPHHTLHRRKVTTPVMSTTESYDASSIKILEGLDAVRQRPGMYIGSTDPRGLHHLVWEVVDNSVDEAMAGYADTITVTLRDDHEPVNGVDVDSIEVIDNGRGIPVALHSNGRPTVEVVMTHLHAGGKFDSDSYAVSGGLHGVGISVVNALSVDVHATVWRDKREWQMSFNYAQPSELQDIGGTRKRGTAITFTPDPAIFGDAVNPETGRLGFEWDIIVGRLETMAYLNPSLTINLIDKRARTESRNVELNHPGGVNDYVKHLVKNPVHPNVIDFSGVKDGVEVEGAIQWTSTGSSVLRTFVNTIDTREGGSHDAGFRAALTKALNARAKAKLTGNDVLDGIRVVLSLKHPNPQFEGQTKTKLGNAPVTGIVQSIVYESLTTWLDAHPNEAKKILAHASVAAEARAAATRAKDKVQNKGGLSLGSKPGKLARCRSRKPEECEIYIVEGDSAGGSAKSGRDSYMQAILPIRGKVPNAVKNSPTAILANEELGTLITALGCGVGPDCDPAKLNYHKIIPLADADIDGAHIATLLLCFLWQYMRPVIEGGYVYLPNPPLYCIKWSKGEPEYAYSDAERDRLLAKGRAKGRKIRDNGGIQRYKGLGEMNPSELWSTTMNPAGGRVLERMVVDDPDQMDELVDLLMGDGNAARRFGYITTNADVATAVVGD